jgi:cell wall-associated NlpC family hydrolase
MDYRNYRRHAVSVTALAVVLVLGSASLTFGVTRLSQAPTLEISLGGAQPETRSAQSGFAYRRLANPDRTEILDQAGARVAVLTDGARTAHLFGKRRTFAEPRFTNAKVVTDVYTRLAPRAWAAGAEKEKWFTDWLAEARTTKSPDVLAVAMTYTYGARPQKNKEGLQVAGDAAFGPLSNIDPDGRAENSDFYDYLGVSWEFADGRKEQASPTHLRSLDCSGFVRMVYGYRLGYPLRGTNTAGEGLPRRAIAIAGVGPGVQLMPNTGQRATALDRLMPGDMLFFNAGPIGGKHIEHMGMYLGVDDRGHHRFVSSRSQANGPTMGDLAGESILDGTGYWAVKLRTARRV